MSTFSNTAREVEMPNGDIVKLHDAVTPNSTSNIKKFKYDDNGHVTESEAANATDLNLNSYATPTSGTTAIGTSDNVQTAIGKLDHQSHIDQTNILSVKDMVCDDAFSTSKSYAVGDITIYDNKLYKFKNAHQGAWSASDVDQISLSEQNSDFVVATNNLKYILNNDRKNLCTRNGEPWSSNTMVSGYFGDDGTLYVSTSGAITANSNLYFADTFLLQAGVEYKFGLCPGSGPVRLALVNATGEWVANQFGTTPSTYTPSATGKFSMYVYIYSGTNITNHPITPMICPSEVWDYDSTYVQPARTNAELTVFEAEDRAGLIDVVDGGAKNLLKRTASGSSWTDDNVTFTLNSDGSITINSTGTITANRYFAYFEGRMSELVNTAGNYVLFASASPNAQAQVWWYYTDDWTNVVETSGNSSRYISALDLNRPVIVRIRALAGNAISNVKVYPMICTKAAFGVSNKFVPYKGNFITVPVSKNVRYNCTSTDYEHVTALDFAVPSNTYAKVTASLKFSNGAPRGIKIIDTAITNPTNAIVAINESTENYGGITASCLLFNAGTVKTYAVYTKSASVSGNDVIITLEYLS